MTDPAGIGMPADVVTGALSYTGKYITRRLLAAGRRTIGARYANEMARHCT